MSAPNCDLFTGKMKTACIAANKSAGYDEQGNKLPGSAPEQGGSNSFLGIPLPGSDFWRHFMFRAGEVIIGIALVVVGVKAFTNSSDTAKVIVQGAKKVNKKLDQ